MDGHLQPQWGGGAAAETVDSATLHQPSLRRTGASWTYRQRFTLPSLRAISRWLEEKHGVSLSAAAISRALNTSEVHLERLAESIATPARYVATIYGCSPMDLLFGKVAKDGPTQLEVLSDTQPENAHDIDRWDDMQYLASVWNPIPHEVQLLLEPYLNQFLTDGDYDLAQGRADEESPE